MRLQAVSATACAQVSHVWHCFGRRGAAAAARILLPGAAAQADVLEDQRYKLPHCCRSCAHHAVRVPGSPQQPETDSQDAADCFLNHKERQASVHDAHLRPATDGHLDMSTQSGYVWICLDMSTQSGYEHAVWIQQMHTSKRATCRDCIRIKAVCRTLSCTESSCRRSTCSTAPR